ncbi:hypothetical protein PG985_005410 [Apiospora marii]|uniref:uncharacterized protein n=1 Tax=Apiospora marii TaxID=335849 RepID=UPI00312DB710
MPAETSGRFTVNGIRTGTRAPIGSLDVDHRSTASHALKDKESDMSISALSQYSIHSLVVAEQVNPRMCPIWQADNEGKMQLLPLAASSQLVFDAVAAASFHRLAYHDDPSFDAKADRQKPLRLDRFQAVAGTCFLHEEVPTTACSPLLP